MKRLYILITRDYEIRAYARHIVAEVDIDTNAMAGKQ